MTRNPPWTRDELILALDLYFTLDFTNNSSKFSPASPEIYELSTLLNSLPIYPKNEVTEGFRNPNGVYMKLANFLALDPEYHGKGLDRVSQLDLEIWEAYYFTRDELHHVASLIRQEHELVAYEEVRSESEIEYPEGHILTTLHRKRERNSKVVRNKKKKVLQETGALRCEVCDFDFSDFYGALGEGFAECHHIVPLSEVKTTRKTSISDLAIVCSNCHSMLHRGAGVTTEELRAIVQSRR